MIKFHRCGEKKTVKINEHLFEYPSDNRRQKTCQKKYQMTDRSTRLSHIRRGKFTEPVNYKIHRTYHLVLKHKVWTTQD